MQVDYDSTYLNEDNEAQKKLKARNKLINNHKQIICDVHMDDAQDYEALTLLYRKIFKFLLEFAPNSKVSDKGIEKEVAAALESVFPRVGLKAFIQLPEADKMTQILELARIVLGIRLFNREENRGGAGLDHMERDAVRLVDVLLSDLKKEMEYFQDACEKYQRAIVRAYLYRRKKKFLQKEAEKQFKEIHEDGGGPVGRLSHNNSNNNLHSHTHPHHHHRHGLKSTEMFLISQLEDVNDYVIERWSQELANRRQYFHFLITLQQELQLIQTKIKNNYDKLKAEMVTIKSLVSNKSSVPKELVYPRFDSIGGIWCSLYEEVVILVARSNTFQVLNNYRLSFSPTLADELHGDEGMENVSLQPDNDNHHHQKESETEEEKQRRLVEEQSKVGGVDDEMLVDDSFANMNQIQLSNQEQLQETMNSLATNNNNHHQSRRESYRTNGAILLTPDTTPDFALLPLELQGFCPWTITETRGLLLPGKPQFGIVRYENRYYVFDHLVALNAFIREPEKYLLAIRNRALQQPEYIHLLRLNHWFPTSNLQRLLEKHDQELLLQQQMGFMGQSFTKEIGVGTPLHFTETYVVDLNYHWNEWELRRRALRIVDLKQCVTHSTQTNTSHYRRENDSQVYLPREQGTQTKRNQGTNPPTVTTYIEGFRGKKMITNNNHNNNHNNNSHSVSNAADDKASYNHQVAYPSSKAEGKDDKRSHNNNNHSSYNSIREDKAITEKKIAYPKVSVVKLTLDL
jgi:hypothetical protein